MLTIFLTINTYIQNDGCKQQNAANELVWCEELVTLGYGPSLLAPIPTVQATLCAIDMPNLHKSIQEIDTTTLNECEVKGVYTPSS